MGISREVGLQLVFQALEMEQTPAKIGRFEVRERLGRGGMGTVFRAFDPELRRDVALKVLDGTVDAAGAEAVREEARALARLAHPNVVAVYELGIERGQVFLAMEYVPGLTLRQRVQDDAPPDTSTLIDWFVQAGRGLQAAHDAGLIHRDIKPDNLLVSVDGRVRLADFGLACLAEAAPPAQVAGTPTFMAPEVERSGLTSIASDQYAFCASLWRVLDPHAELGSREADIPVGVRQALVRGLSPAPKDRWPSMTALLESLVPPKAEGVAAWQREVLLNRVERLWIEGVLHASLAGGPVLELPLSESPGHVDAPFTGPAESPPESAALSSLMEKGQGALLVLGEPGSGKTTTLLRLAETLIAEARLDSRAPAPVVLNLASLAKHRGAFEPWVEQELVSKYGLPRQVVRRWLAEGSLVLLLDGLDEIAPAKRSACVEALGVFRADRGLPMAVSCRTSDYDSLPNRLRFGHAVQIDPLPASVVEAQLGGARGLADTVWTPLMLSLFSRSEGDIPADEEPLSWLYEQYLRHQLAAVPDAERVALLRSLGTLAAAMSRVGRSELWLEQLAPEWVFSDGRRGVSQALALGLLVAFCLSINMSVGWGFEGDAWSGMLFGLGSVPVVLALSGGLRIQPVERLRFSLARLARLLPLSLALGVGFGALYGYFYIVWVNVVFGVVSAVVVAVTVAFEPSLQETGIRPNQGMRQSLLNAVGIGSLGFVLGAVCLGYVAVPAVLPYLGPESSLVGIPHPERSAAAVAGALLGTLSGLVRGGWAVLQHIAVRLVLAATTPVPLRLVPLLDRAVDLGLMRRVGGGCLFIHRTFQSFLAERYSGS